jgi:hypothetical protein
MGKRGGTTRAKRYGRAQIRAWGKLGGRPHKLDGSALARLSRIIRHKVPKAEIAKRLEISTRTVTSYVSRINAQG